MRRLLPSLALRGPRRRFVRVFSRHRITQLRRVKFRVPRCRATASSSGAGLKHPPARVSILANKIRPAEALLDALASPKSTCAHPRCADRARALSRSPPAPRASAVPLAPWMRRARQQPARLSRRPRGPLAKSRRGRGPVRVRGPRRDRRKRARCETPGPRQPVDARVDSSAPAARDPAAVRAGRDYGRVSRSYGPPHLGPHRSGPRRPGVARAMRAARMDRVLPLRCPSTRPASSQRASAHMRAFPRAEEAGFAWFRGCASCACGARSKSPRRCGV